MKLWVVVFVFVLGVGLGLAAPSLAPKYLDAYVPKVLQTTPSQVRGTVVKKQEEDERLLLTVSAPEGALLAIFEAKRVEVSLLVERGDGVTLGVGTYAPFVKDPQILRVTKPTVESAAPAAFEPEAPNPPVEDEPAASGLNETISEMPSSSAPEDNADVEPAPETPDASDAESSANSPPSEDML